MGVTTTAKRGDARSAPSRPSHVRREVIGVLLITASLFILLSLVSFVPGDAKSLTTSGPAAAAARRSDATMACVIASSWAVVAGTYVGYGR